MRAYHYTFILAAIGVAALTASAGRGERARPSVSTAPIPPPEKFSAEYSCHIQSLEAKTGNAFPCTATVISRKHLITAAHCAPKETYTRVVCPNKVVTSVLPKTGWTFFAPELDSTSDSTSLEGNDLALVETSQELRNESVLIPRTEEEWQDAVSEENTCQILRHDKEPLIQSARNLFRLPEMSSFDQIVFAKLEPRIRLSEVLFLNQVELHPGDSGGGVVCTSAKGVTYLVGINSVGIRFRNIEFGLATSIRSKLNWINSISRP